MAALARGHGGPARRASFTNLYAASEAFDMLEYDVPRPLPDDIDDAAAGRPARSIG